VGGRVRHPPEDARRRDRAGRRRVERRRHAGPLPPRPLVLNVAPAVLAAFALAAAAGAPRFLPDDPLLIDPDRLPIAKPRPVALSNVYDVLENTLAHRPSGTTPPAVNVNTLGEV